MKVGDTVKIHDIDKCDFGCPEEMKKYEGKVGVIIGAYADLYHDIAYRLSIDKGEFIYSENVLRKVKVSSNVLENE